MEKNIYSYFKQSFFLFQTLKGQDVENFFLIK